MQPVSMLWWEGAPDLISAVRSAEGGVGLSVHITAYFLLWTKVGQDEKTGVSSPSCIHCTWWTLSFHPPLPPTAWPQRQHRQLLLGCLQHSDFAPYFWWSHFEWQESSLWCQQGVIHSVQPRPEEWFLVTKKRICLFADGKGGLLSDLWFSL